MRRHFVRGMAICVVLGCLSGCGKHGPPTGTVQGAVTYQKEAVTEGFVIFENQTEGWTRSAKLKPDGSYEHPEVPVGEYVVCIVPPEPKLPDETSGFRGGPTTHVMPETKNIPKAYREAESTPLRAHVVEDSNTINFELED